jgi:hypothetical protein
LKTGLIVLAIAVWRTFPQVLARAFRVKSIEPAQIGPRPALDWDRCMTSPKAGRQFVEAYYDAFKGQQRTR